MKVLLVGNYPYDGSTSMDIWAKALRRELQQLGVDVRLIAPQPVLGRLKRSSSGIGKWLGYIDRFVLFPRVLRAAAAQVDVVHLCDHGSAIYSTKVNGTPAVVTCHDMVAVRGALGEVPDCPASLFGRWLQRWICSGLKNATRVACISQATYDDAHRILGSDHNLRVVMNGLNYPFRQLPAEEVNSRLASLPEIRRPFVLHIGSNLKRKNRDGVLRIFAQAAEGTDLQMVFAGNGLNKELMALAKELKVDDRIIQVVKPDVKVIEALYNRALVLLFPSHYEGFGWPPIEAQACGCSVVASDIPPIAEVLRDSAVLHSSEDEAGMAASIRKLLFDSEYREQMRVRGLENVRTRFQTTQMMNGYLAVYQEMICQSSRR